MRNHIDFTEDGGVRVVDPNGWGVYITPDEARQIAMQLEQSCIPSAYTSEFDRPDEYYKEIEMPTVGDYRQMLRFKDRSTALFDKRWQAAKSVIDAIAQYVGIDPETCGLYLYAPDDENGDSEMRRRLDNWFDRSGDKAKLKKRIDELENENNVLRSLVGK